MKVEVDGKPLDYSKIISVLFAFLVAIIGYIWNNSQKQIDNGLRKVDELTKTVSMMQTQIGNVMFKIEALQMQIEIQGNNINSIRNDPYYSTRAARPRFERK